MDTQKIDVLAVMEANAVAANIARRADPYVSDETIKACVQESAEARAAVAELIEDNAAMRGAIDLAIIKLGQDGANVANGPGRDTWMLLRMCLTVMDNRVALARIGGAA